MLKVGDEVMLRGVIDRVDSDDKRLPYRITIARDYALWLKADHIAQPWHILRAAAALYSGSTIVVEALLNTADRLEAAAKPPSLIDAARALVASWPAAEPGEPAHMVNLRRAVEAAEREPAR